MSGLCALVLVSAVFVISATAGGAETVASKGAARQARELVRFDSAAALIARARAQARQQVAAQRRTLASARAQTPQAVICRVFGPHCSEALAVARCESGYRTDAQNGQYLGLFQMGDWARANYGHGASAHVQAKAAHRLFVDTGRTWGPWSCKP